MAIEINGVGRAPMPPPWQGCDQPRRTNRGLHPDAILGLKSIPYDEELQEAIRGEIAREGDRDLQERHPAVRLPSEDLAELEPRRLKLVEVASMPDLAPHEITQHRPGPRDMRLMHSVAGILSSP